jgi:hypothetical protein
MGIMPVYVSLDIFGMPLRSCVLLIALISTTLMGIMVWTLVSANKSINGMCLIVSSIVQQSITLFPITGPIHVRVLDNISGISVHVN